MLRRTIIGADGKWVPFVADAKASYEFVITMPGYATTHIYRSAFLRSSSVINLQAQRLADADKAYASVISMVRPRGFFGVPRDVISLDGKSPPPGVPSGTPGVSSVKLQLDGQAGRAVAGDFDGERVVVRAWPAAANHVVVIELQK